MRLASFVADDEIRVGVLDGESLWDLRSVWFQYLVRLRHDPQAAELAKLDIPSDMAMFIARWHGQTSTLRSALDMVEADGATRDERTFRLRVSETKILAPILRPSKIVCVGNAFRQHIIAAAASRGISEDQVEIPPSAKVSFLKTASAVIGQGEPIRFPREYELWDYEGELAIVIGRPCSRVSKEAAREYIFGYTIMNDASLRDVPTVMGGGTSPSAKSSDTLAPLGPAIATQAVLGEDPNRLRIRTWVNGELRQDASTAEFMWPVEEMVSEVSRYMTLWPGDIIATSSPPGTGMETGKYLREGDTVRIEISGIGVLENPVGAPR